MNSAHGTSLPDGAEPDWDVCSSYELCAESPFPMRLMAWIWCLNATLRWITAPHAGATRSRSGLSLVMRCLRRSELFRREDSSGRSALLCADLGSCPSPQPSRLTLVG